MARPRLRKLAALVAVGGCLTAVPLAFAGTHVYASAPMGGPGGVWETGYNNVNYNRMSAPSHGVSVTYCTPSICPSPVNTVNFVQINVFTYATSVCFNKWSTITNGYCAWYD